MIIKINGIETEVPENYFGEETNEQKIAELKKELADTDYKISKCYEYEKNGLPMPYDIEALHAERQALRDEINRLEGDMNN